MKQKVFLILTIATILFTILSGKINLPQAQSYWSLEMPKVIINEVALNGTASSPEDQWLELFNLTLDEIDLTGWTLEDAENNILITLAGTIEPRGYFLLERGDDQTISSVSASQIFETKIPAPDNILHLILKNNQAEIIDEINEQKGSRLEIISWRFIEESPEFADYLNDSTLIFKYFQLLAEARSWEDQDPELFAEENPELFEFWQRLKNSSEWDQQISIERILFLMPIMHPGNKHTPLMYFYDNLEQSQFKQKDRSNNNISGTPYDINSFYSNKYNHSLMLEILLENYNADEALEMSSEGDVLKWTMDYNQTINIDQHMTEEDINFWQEMLYFRINIDDDENLYADPLKQIIVENSFEYELKPEELGLKTDQEYTWSVEAYSINIDLFEYKDLFIAVVKRSQPGRFKIKAPEIDPLILKYEPILYFHPAEDFYPSNAEAFAENSSLWDSQGANPDILLKPESLEDPVKLTDLTPASTDTAEWYLQFSENLENKIPDPEKALTEYQELINSGQAKNTYYARKMEDSWTDEQGVLREFIVLQYWYFYYMNDFGAKVEKGNNHEGDWEVVMVFLDKETEEARFVAYSSHHNIGQAHDPIWFVESVRRSWDSNEVVKQDERIVSFVSLGSHANYPNNGDGTHYVSATFPDDLTSVQGTKFFTDDWQKIEIMQENSPDWLLYEGTWGVIPQLVNPLDELFINSGPQGPYYSENDKFISPVLWAGLDKVGEVTLYEGEQQVVEFTEQSVKMGLYAIGTTILEGKSIVVDLHDEIVVFGKNIQDKISLPHFWEITSDLENETFEAEIIWDYDLAEAQAFGIDPSKLSAYVYNETDEIWVKVPSIVDLENNQVKIQTTHFSKYMLAQEKEVWQDITEKVKVQETKKKFSKKKQEQSYQVRIKNKDKEKQEIKGELRLVLENLPEGTEILESDGQTQEGKHYLDFSDSYKWCRYTGETEDIPEELEGKGVLKKAIMKKLEKKKLIKKEVCQVLEENNEELKGKLKYVLPKGKQTERREIKFRVLKKIKKKELEWKVENK